MAAEAHWVDIGPHRYRIEEDLVSWHFVGEVALEHVQRGMAETEVVHDCHGYCLNLMNAGDVTRMTPEARRYLGEQSKLRHGKSAVAIFNASRVAVAISQLIASVTRIWAGKAPLFCLVRTEADARLWLSKQRQLLSPGSGSRP